MELILPEELYESVKEDFLTDRLSLMYSRVIMPLQGLLEGSFFNEYIKKGRIKTPNAYFKRLHFWKAIF